MLFRPSDWIALSAALLSLGGLVGVGEVLRHYEWSPVLTRRLVHAGVGLFVVATPLFFSGPGPLYGLAVAFVLVNAAAKSGQWWQGIHAARPESWGTVVLPLALLPALAATWSVGSGRIFVLQIAFLIVALADPLASWAGQTRETREWMLGATVVGSGIFLGVAFCLTLVGVLGLADWTLERALLSAAVVSVVATAIEAISDRGWDNLFVVVGILLVLVSLHEATITTDAFVLALTVGTGFGVGAYAGRALDARGAMGGSLFAASLVGLGGWAWVLPGVIFFVLSSALSRLGVGASSYEAQGESEAGRSLSQVLANGGVAWGLLAVFALFPSGPFVQEGCYAGFLGALAAAAADTWATEIGMWSSRQPWSLRTFSRVEAGVSGAVSLAGTGGAVLGAASVAGAAWVTGGTLGVAGWDVALAVVSAGLVGMSVDSLFGATIQARYREPDTGRLVEERPDSAATPALGWNGVDNEVVNALGTTAGALAAMVFV